MKAEDLDKLFDEGKDITQHLDFSNKKKIKRKLSKLFWMGLVLFVLGSAPLLIIIALASLGITKDPNPNPVGFGIMAMFTFWPGIGIMIISLFKKNK